MKYKSFAVIVCQKDVADIFKYIFEKYLIPVERSNFEINFNPYTSPTYILNCLNGSALHFQPPDEKLMRGTQFNAIHIICDTANFQPEEFGTKNIPLDDLMREFLEINSKETP